MCPMQATDGSGWEAEDFLVFLPAAHVHFKDHRPGRNEVGWGAGGMMGGAVFISEPEIVDNALARVCWGKSDSKE